MNNIKLSLNAFIKTICLTLIEHFDWPLEVIDGSWSKTNKTPISVIFFKHFSVTCWCYFNLEHLCIISQYSQYPSWITRQFKKNTLTLVAVWGANVHLVIQVKHSSMQSELLFTCTRTKITLFLARHLIVPNWQSTPMLLDSIGLLKLFYAHIFTYLFWKVICERQADMANIFKFSHFLCLFGYYSCQWLDSDHHSLTLLSETERRQLCAWEPISRSGWWLVFCLIYVSWVITAECATN